MSQPFTWIIFGCILITYILASIHVKLLSQSVTFGSAGYAERCQFRVLRARRAHGWLLCTCLFMVRTPVALLVTTTHTLGVASHHVRLRRRRTATQFYIGVYRHRLITLPEHVNLIIRGTHVQFWWNDELNE